MYTCWLENLHLSWHDNEIHILVFATFPSMSVWRGSLPWWQKKLVLFSLSQDRVQTLTVLSRLYEALVFEVTQEQLSTANCCQCCLQNPGQKRLRTGLAWTLAQWSFFSPGTRWLDISNSLVTRYVTFSSSTQSKDNIDNGFYSTLGASRSR